VHAVAATHGVCAELQKLVPFRYISFGGQGRAPIGMVSGYWTRPHSEIARAVGAELVVWMVTDLKCC